MSVRPSVNSIGSSTHSPSLYALTSSSLQGNQTGTGGTAQRSPLYPEIGSRHKLEMIDAPTNARRYRVADRSVIVISSGPHGHPAGATGVHARRTAILPEAVRRRQRGSAMFAAKPHEAEQELPEGIPEPRNVNQRVAASGGNGRSGIRDYSDYPMLPIGLLAFQLRFGRTSALLWPQTWQVWFNVG
jgi:hypothetical protein